MAPSDSQHPEIGVREERSKKRKRWRKQNKINIKAILHHCGWSWVRGRAGAMKRDEGRDRNREQRK